MGGVSSTRSNAAADYQPPGGARALSARQQEMVHSLMRDGLQPDVAFAHHQMPRLPPPGSQPDQDQRTVRLKNDVNVKRASLSIVRHDSKVAVKVEVDAMVPCVLRVYFLATEVVNDKNTTLRYETKAGSAVTERHFEAGLGQVFEQSADEALDFSGVEESALYTRPEPSSRYYPLIITVDKDDSKHTRLETKEDAAGIRHVFSQSTYITFVKRADESVQAKVVKQKIHIDGFSYELQEIYGLDSARAQSESTNSAAQVELPRGQDCVICLTEPRDTTILPCRHMCVCHDCAQILRQQTNRCPICRCHVESLLKISVSDSKPQTPAADAQTS